MADPQRNRRFRPPRPLELVRDQLRAVSLELATARRRLERLDTEPARRAALHVTRLSVEIGSLDAAAAASRPDGYIRTADVAGIRHAFPPNSTVSVCGGPTSAGAYPGVVQLNRTVDCERCRELLATVDGWRS